MILSFRKLNFLLGLTWIACISSQCDKPSPITFDYYPEKAIYTIAPTTSGEVPLYRIAYNFNFDTTGKRQIPNLNDVSSIILKSITLRVISPEGGNLSAFSKARSILYAANDKVLLQNFAGLPPNDNIINILAKEEEVVQFIKNNPIFISQAIGTLTSELKDSIKVEVSSHFLFKIPGE